MFCTNTYFQLNLSCFPSLDSQITFATIRLVLPWRHPLYLFVVFHASTVWFVSTVLWNWRCLHMYLPCSGQHWCEQTARASSCNRVCRLSNDSPKSRPSILALPVDTLEYTFEAILEPILEPTPEDTLELEATFEAILVAALVAMLVAALQHNP